METGAFRFLVVDDSELMRRVMCDVLVRLGLEDVDEAGDGVEALIALRKRRYDVVVTDLSMPRMNGIDLLRAIRVMPGREAAAVLLASGHLTERNLREARESGVDGFLPKPFIEGPLTEQVTRLLTRLRVARRGGAPEQSIRPLRSLDALVGSLARG